MTKSISPSLPQHLGPLIFPLLALAAGFTASGSCGEAQGARLKTPEISPSPAYRSDGPPLKEIAPKSLPVEPPAPAMPVDPDSPLDIEDPTGRALDAFFEGLRSAEAAQPDGRVAIVQFGDSHTSADYGTSRLRRHLQKRFGDAGRGFMLPGKPFKGYYQRDASFGSEGEWQIQNGLKASAIEPFGLAGIRTSSDSLKSIAWVSTCEHCPSGERVSRFEIFYRRYPSGGRMKILIDEKPWDEIDTRTTSQPAKEETLGGYVTIAVPEGQHRLKIQPSGEGMVDLFGIVMERDVPGVVLDSIGVNGAQAFHLLRMDWTLISEQLAHRDPRLVILAYGTNESANHALNPKKLEGVFVELIKQVKAAVPGASILVLGPPDRNVRTRDDCDGPKGKSKGAKPTAKPTAKPPLPSSGSEVPLGCEWKTPRLLVDIVDAQRRAAAKEGVAFFDAYLAMGGSGTVEIWSRQEPALAQRDHTHLTKNGYETNADLLFEALMRSYESYLLNAPPLSAPELAVPRASAESALEQPRASAARAEE